MIDDRRRWRPLKTNLFMGGGFLLIQNKEAPLQHISLVHVIHCINDAGEDEGLKRWILFTVAVFLGVLLGVLMTVFMESW